MTNERRDECEAVAFLDFAHAVVSQIKQWLAEGEQCLTRPHAVARFNGKSATVETENLPLYESLFWKHPDALASFQTAGPAVSELKSRLSELGVSPCVVQADTRAANAEVGVEALRHIVLAALLESHPLPASDAVFLSTYKSVIREWASPARVWQLIVPIRGLSIETKAIPLSHGLVCVALSDEDRGRFWQMVNRLPPVGMSSAGEEDFGSVHAAMLAEFEVPRNESPQPHLFDQHVLDALTALRLEASGAVSASTVHCCLCSVGGGYTRQSHPLPGGPADRRGGVCIIDGAAAGRVADRLAAIQRLRNKNELRSLAVGIRYFNQSFGRESLDDRVMDFATALGSILAMGERSEITYRIALNASALLAPLRLPRTTYREVENLFWTRNQITHAGASLDELSGKPRLGELLDGVVTPLGLAAVWEQVVRHTIASLIAHLDSGRSLKSIMLELHDSIIGGLVAVPQAQRSSDG